MNVETSSFALNPVKNEFKYPSENISPYELVYLFERCKKNGSLNEAIRVSKRQNRIWGHSKMKPSNNNINNGAGERKFWKNDLFYLLKSSITEVKIIEWLQSDLQERIEVFWDISRWFPSFPKIFISLSGWPSLAGAHRASSMKKQTNSNSGSGKFMEVVEDHINQSICRGLHSKLLIRERRESWSPASRRALHNWTLRDTITVQRSRHLGQAAVNTRQQSNWKPSHEASGTLRPTDEKWLLPERIEERFDNVLNLIGDREKYAQDEYARCGSF